MRLTTARLFICLWMGLAAGSLPAYGEVVASAPNGFSVKLTSLIEAEPLRVYDAIVRVGNWWDGNHTFFGSAANLSLEDRAGGCFCEVAGAGRSVQHMTVVYADRGKGLRLRGGLGPMIQMGVEAALLFNLVEVEQKTRVEVIQNAGGYSPEGLDKLAPLVDRVLSQQLARLKKYVETGKPE